MTIFANGCAFGDTPSMQGALLTSPPSMSPSVAVGETQAPACKRLKTSLNEFEDDEQGPAVSVYKLVTYMSLRIPPETPDEFAALVASERASCVKIFSDCQETAVLSSVQLIDFASIQHCWNYHVPMSHWVGPGPA